MSHFASPNEALNQSPDRLTITVMQGDDIDFEMDVVSIHESASDPTSLIEVDVDVYALSFDSSVYEELTKKELTKLQITDSPDVQNRVRIYLSGVETGQMMPGTYGYWVDWVSGTGTRRTVIKAPLEVLRK